VHRQVEAGIHRPVAELDLAAPCLERLREFGMLTADHGRTQVWIGELIDRQAELVEGILISDESRRSSSALPLDRRDMPEIVSYPFVRTLSPARAR
jgi:hypothetical protein